MTFIAHTFFAAVLFLENKCVLSLLVIKGVSNAAVRKTVVFLYSL